MSAPEGAQSEICVFGLCDFSSLYTQSAFEASQKKLDSTLKNVFENNKCFITVCYWF